MKRPLSYRNDSPREGAYEKGNQFDTLGTAQIQDVAAYGGMSVA